MKTPPLHDDWLAAADTALDAAVMSADDGLVAVNARVKEAANTSPKTAGLKRPHLHYLWINENPPAPAGVIADQTAPLSSVKLGYLDKAIKNARAYPDVPVTIWLDHAMLDAGTRFFVESHIYMNAPENLRLADLRDIPAYRDEPYVFDPQEPGDIWARVDYARLLVMAHDFAVNDTTHSFYADFDVEDVMLGDALLGETLRKHGMIYGRTFTGGMIENSFMGFARGRGEKFLCDKLIPATRDCAVNDFNGYSALTNAVYDWVMERPDRRSESAISPIKMVQTMGYRIEPDPFYVQHGLSLG